MKYSVVLPCKDEESTIAICIHKIKKVLPSAEIIVVDNNSSDRSAAIARSKGAIVVKEKAQGYGAALRRGFSEAKGEYIIMCDADNTYDLREIPKLLKFKNYDIVIGNRFNNMAADAMPIMHRYLGNPLLSLVLRTFFKIKTKDTHSGFRLIKRESLDKLKLTSSGMELASEMLMKAAKHRMKIKEVPISYHARVSESKIHSFRDGWKHLRLMLLYSPNYLYLVPGFSLFLLGLLIMLLLLPGPFELVGLKFFIHPMFIGSLLTIMGYQILLLWLFSRIYMITYMDEKDPRIKLWLSKLTLEKGVVIGVLIFLVGLIININTIIVWIRSDFGPLNDIRFTLLGLTLILLGIQTIFSSFYLSILGMKNEQ